MSARDKRESDSRIIEAKLGVWKLCIALWVVQCRYRGSQSVGHRYRADKIEEVIIVGERDRIVDYQYDDKEIIQIYDNS